MHLVSRTLVPIQTIPNEILLDIFSNYIYSTLNPLPSGSFTDVSFEPWLLSQVCREWRQLVFSSSALWRKVSVMKETYPSRKISRKREKAALYLLPQHMKYAHGKPLRMIFHFKARSSENYYKKLLNIVLPYRHCWQSLEYRHPQAEYIMDSLSREGHYFVHEIFVPSGPTLEFTLLEELQLLYPDCVAAVSFTDRVTFPKLKSVVLSSFSPWASDSPLPWSNLETLQMTCIGLIDMLTILPDPVNLRELTLSHYTYGAAVANFFNVKPIVLPKLESLSLTDACPLLSMIVTPSLKTLALLDEYQEEKVDFEDPENVTSFVEMIQRSFCSVTTLELCLPFAPDPPILPLFPNLTTLSINIGMGPVFSLKDVDPWHFSNVAADLAARTTNGEDFALCPLIETLVIAFNDEEPLQVGDNETTAVLLDLVEARFLESKQNTRLRCVKMMYCDAGLHEGFVQQLRALRARGLDIHFYYDDGLDEIVY